MTPSPTPRLVLRQWWHKKPPWLSWALLAGALYCGSVLNAVLNGPNFLSMLFLYWFATAHVVMQVVAPTANGETYGLRAVVAGVLGGVLWMLVIALIAAGYGRWLYRLGWIIVLLVIVYAIYTFFTRPFKLF